MMATARKYFSPLELETTCSANNLFMVYDDKTLKKGV